MRSSSPSLLTILAVSLLLPSTNAATSSSSCYYPSGNLAPPNDVPCNTETDGHSACCGKGVACLSSGLCFDNGLISRGSCTDQNFADESCARACTDFTPSAGAPILLASTEPNSDIANMGWCCGFPINNITCPQGGTIKIAAGTVYTTAGAPSTSTLTSTSTSTPSSSATLTSSSSVSSTLATSSAGSGSGGSSSAGKAQCEENHDVAIGAGVGVPLGMAALICLGLWLRERRARRRERGEGDLKKGLGGYDGFNGSGNGVYHQGNYGLVGERDRKNPRELGDGRRPEELP